MMQLIEMENGLWVVRGWGRGGRKEGEAMKRQQKAPHGGGMLLVWTVLVNMSIAGW